MHDDERYAAELRRKRLVFSGLGIGALVAAGAAAIVLSSGAGGYDPSDFDQRAACADFYERTIEQLSALIGEAGEGLDDVADEGRDAFVEDCLTMEPELVWCMAYGDLESPECTRAYERQAGLVSGTPAAAGPPVAWQMQLETAPLDLDVLPDGLVIYTLDSAVVAARDGEIVWQQSLEGESSGWLLDLGDDGLLTADDSGTVFDLDAATGAVSWRVQTDEVYAAEPLGQDVLLLTAGQATRVLSPSLCATTPDTCLGPPEPIDSGRHDARAHWLSVGPTGMRVYWTEESVTVTTASNELLAHAQTQSYMTLLSDPAIGAGETVHLIVDEELVALHPPSCSQSEGQGVLLPPSLHDGERFDRLPDGCLRQTAHLDEPDLVAPTPVANHGVLVSANSQLALVVGGRVDWRAEPGVTSRLIERGDGVVFVCGAEDYQSSVALCRVGIESGGLDWRTPLPGAPASGFLVAESLIDIEGDWTVVAHETYSAAVHHP